MNFNDPNSPSTPLGAAPNKDDGSQETAEPSKTDDAESQVPNQSVSSAPRSAAQADGSKHDLSSQSFDEWAARGGALRTTYEARLYLFDAHDILLPERYTQKLVSEKRKLDGRRGKKPGGGSQLYIKLPSIDAYATGLKQSSIDRFGDDHSHEWHPSKQGIDPDDKLYHDLQRIAEAKPYAVPTNQKTETPVNTAPPNETPSKSTIDETEPLNQDQSAQASVEPSAPIVPGASTQPAPNPVVPREMFEQALQRGDELKQLLQEERSARQAEQSAFTSEREGMLQDLSAAYDRVANIADAMASLATKQPSEIIQGIRDVIRGNGNVATPEIIPAPEHDTSSAQSTPETPAQTVQHHGRHNSFRQPRH